MEGILFRQRCLELSTSGNKTIGRNVLNKSCELFINTNKIKDKNYFPYFLSSAPYLLKLDWIYFFFYKYTGYLEDNARWALDQRNKVKIAIKQVTSFFSLEFVSHITADNDVYNMISDR